MLSIRTKATAAGLIVGAASATAGLALATGGQAPTTLAFDDAPTPMAHSVDADQLAFPVLRRPRTSTDAMPDAVAAQVGNPAVGGKNVALARAISTSAGTGWVIPGNGSICVAVPDPASATTIPMFGVTCNATAWATRHGLALLLLDPRTATGVTTVIAPEHADVSIARQTGVVSRIPIDPDGVASSAVAAGDSVRIQTPTGNAVLRVPTDTR